jgi:EF-hand domain pair
MCERRWAGKICRNGINCRARRRPLQLKAALLLGFRDGTPLAQILLEIIGRAVRLCRSLLMLPALSVATSALDLLKSLTATKSQSTGNKQPPKSPFDLSGGTEASEGAPARPGAGGGSLISAATMSALLAAQSHANSGSTRTPSTSRWDALKELFAQVDADGNGTLSKSEFENALGAGGTNLAKGDSVFEKLDKDGNGAVSLDEMMSALNGKRRHPHAAGPEGAAGSGTPAKDPLMAALRGASSTSVTNSDGSITTSLTYADGSRVTTTSAATASASSAATSSYDFIDRMIQRQAQAVSSASAASLSVSA